MILRLNFGLDSAVSTYGDPPALLTTTSRRPCRSTIASINAVTASSSRTSQEENSYGRPSPAPSRSWTTRCALPAEPRADPGAHTADSTCHQYHPPGQPQIDGVGCFGASHCASVPSKCLLR